MPALIPHNMQDVSHAERRDAARNAAILYELTEVILDPTAPAFEVTFRQLSQSLINNMISSAMGHVDYTSQVDDTGRSAESYLRSLHEYIITVYPETADFTDEARLHHYTDLYHQMESRETARRSDNDPHSLGGGTFESLEAHEARLFREVSREAQYPFQHDSELQPGYEFDSEEGIINHFPEPETDREFQ